jgi:tetraacyldisaccharide 4'-kinase
MPQIDAVVVIGPGGAGEAVTRSAGLAHKLRLTAALAADPAVAAALGRRPVVAFAGIGRPDKFFATLAGLGVDIVARRAFADHHVYSADEIAGLRRLADAHDAVLVTTEKDAMRIAERERDALVVLPVSLIFEDAAAMAALLTEKLAAARRCLQPATGP